MIKTLKMYTVVCDGCGLSKPRHMVKEMKIYTVVCDSCGEYSNNGKDILVHPEELLSVEIAENQDWETEGNQHYCPKCHENEEEE